MIRKPLFTCKEIDIEKTAFSCHLRMRMLLFSVDIDNNYTFSFTIYTLNPYYGNKFKIRWEILL
ncbi:hypothetical protein C1N86_28480 (plasmid) [Priestia aryabhattai]